MPTLKSSQLIDLGAVQCDREELLGEGAKGTAANSVFEGFPKQPVCDWGKTADQESAVCCRSGTPTRCSHVADGSNTPTLSARRLRRRALR